MDGPTIAVLRDRQAGAQKIGRQDSGDRSFTPPINLDVLDGLRLAVVVYFCRPHCLMDMTPDLTPSSPKSPTTVSREELYKQVWEVPWRQELQPTGILSFSIETYVPSLPGRAWTETADRPLEDHLGDILATLLLAGPLLVQQRREREEAERRRREEERQRYEEAERQRLDDNRWRRFAELAARWRQTDQARRFLAALEQHPDAAANLANDMPIADWLSWARGRLATFDPMADGPAGVFEDILKVTNWTYRQ